MEPKPHPIFLLRELLGQNLTAVFEHIKEIKASPENQRSEMLRTFWSDLGISPIMAMVWPPTGW